MSFISNVPSVRFSSNVAVNSNFKDAKPGDSVYALHLRQVDDQLRLTNYESGTVVSVEPHGNQFTMETIWQFLQRITKPGHPKFQFFKFARDEANKTASATEDDNSEVDLLTLNMGSASQADIRKVHVGKVIAQYGEGSPGDPSEAQYPLFVNTFYGSMIAGTKIVLDRKNEAIVYLTAERAAGTILSLLLKKSRTQLDDSVRAFYQQEEPRPVAE